MSKVHTMLRNKHGKMVSPTNARCRPKKSYYLSKKLPKTYNEYHLKSKISGQLSISIQNLPPKHNSFYVKTLISVQILPSN